MPAKIVNISEDGASLAEQAYQKIKQRLFDFDLMPGDRLSESELAYQVNVSRTPLRQALQRLQHEGFVEPIPKVGWLVPQLNFEKFDELYDFRVLLECFAVRELCAAVEARSELKALTQVWHVSVKRRLQDGARVGALDEAFHTQIVASAGNGEMLRTYREITERIRIIRRLDFIKSERVAERISTTYDEHAEILSAIQRRRADEAQRLLRAHIEFSKLSVRNITLAMLYRARNDARGVHKK